MMLRRHLNRLAGNNLRDLPSLHQYVEYFRERDEEVRANIRESESWDAPCSSQPPISARCTARWCRGVVTEGYHHLCRGHNGIRLEMREAYHLNDRWAPIHANASTVNFREIQLRQLYVEQYNIVPNPQHERWILELALSISWQDVRDRGELQYDSLVHRTLERRFYMSSSSNFDRCALEMARACGCQRCQFRFPLEVFGKYFIFTFFTTSISFVS